MAKYFKKPVVVEAELTETILWAASNNWKALPVWISEAYEKGELLFVVDHVEIKTLEGWVKADTGHMIVKGVEGEIYPCRKDIFTKTHEYVDG